MTDKRFHEILSELKRPEFTIELAENPLTMGPGYVSTTISRVLGVLEKVNEYASEIAQDLAEEKNKLNDLESELKIRTRKFLLSLPKEETEGFNSKMKEELAEQKANEDFIKSWKERFRARNEAPPDEIPDLSDRIRVCKNKIESLS